MKRLFIPLILVLSVLCSCDISEQNEVDKQVYISNSKMELKYPRIFEDVNKAVVLLDDTTFMVIPKTEKTDVEIITKH